MGNGCTSLQSVQIANTHSRSPLANLKVVVVGENLSGKSSIVRRYEKNLFDGDYEPTKSLHIVSIVKKVNVPDERIVAVELWEIPSHGSAEMHKTFYENADAAIVTMDLSDDDSYISAAQWKKDVCMHRNNHSTISLNHESYDRSKSDYFPVLLLGNKYDVVKQAFLQKSVEHKLESDMSRENVWENRINGTGLHSQSSVDNESKLDKDVTEVNGFSHLNGRVHAQSESRDAKKETCLAVKNPNHLDTKSDVYDDKSGHGTGNVLNEEIDDGINQDENDVNTDGGAEEKKSDVDKTKENDADQTDGGAPRMVDSEQKVDNAPVKVGDSAKQAVDDSNKTVEIVKKTSKVARKTRRSGKTVKNVTEISDDDAPKEIAKESSDTTTWKSVDDSTNRKEDAKNNPEESERNSLSKNTNVASSSTTAFNSVDPDTNNEKSSAKMTINHEPDQLKSSETNLDEKQINDEVTESQNNVNQSENNAILTSETIERATENGIAGIEKMEITMEQPMETICSQVESAIIAKGDDDLSHKDTTEDSVFNEIILKPVPTTKLKKLFPKDLKAQTDNDCTTQSSLDLMSSSVQTSSVSLSLMATCVERLEMFAEENGFIAGIPVSARDAKGGVHEAIQSLLRHLLSGKGDSSERKRKNDELSVKSLISTHKRTKKTVNSDIIEEFESLQNVGIIEIDEVLLQCNPALKRAENITASYWETLRDFKRICHAKGVIAEKRASLEECVSALKNAVETWQHSGREKNDIRMSLLLRDQPKYSLVSAEGDGFVNLYVVDDENKRIDVDGDLLLPSHVAALLDFYDQRVHKVCSKVAAQSPELQQQLEHLLLVISDKEEKAWDTAVAAGRTQAEVRRILTGLAQARTRMRGTLEQVRDARKSVVNMQAKIKAVLLF